MRDARVVRWDVLPTHVQTHLKLLMLDTFAVAIGAQGRDHGIIGKVARIGAASGRATMWVEKGKADPLHAALVNGTAAEVLDFQEVWLDGRNNGHAAVVILPALVALAEEAGSVTGKALLEAFAVALMVNARILRALGRAHRAGERGVRTTALGAPIAAALAGAIMIGLDDAGCLAATNHAAGALPIGLLAAMAPGEAAFTPDKDVAVGLSARHAVLSVLLARAGAAAAPRAISGPRGLLATFGMESGRPLDAVPLTDIDLTRYAMKPYPTNYGTQAAIRAAIELTKRVSPEEIASVTARVKASSAKSLANRAIDGPLSARFSLPYAVASALARGRCRLEDFEGAALADRTVHALMARVRVQGDDDLEAMNAADGLFPARLTVETTSGVRHVCSFDDVWDGFDADDRAALVRDKAEALLGRAAAPARAAFLAACEGLDGARDLDPLMASIAGLECRDRPY